MAEDIAPQMIIPPRTLKDKVTEGGPGAVDVEALARVEKVILELADSYLDWVVEDIAKIGEAFAKLKSGDGDMAENLDGIFQVSHDVKGQGGSFGYDLMTVIGNMLCRYIEKSEGKAEAKDIAIIGLHIDALSVVISQNLKGDGGEVGEQLLVGLEQVSAKRSKS